MQLEVTEREKDILDALRRNEGIAKAGYPVFGKAEVVFKASSVKVTGVLFTGN